MLKVTSKDYAWYWSMKLVQNVWLLQENELISVTFGLAAVNFEQIADKFRIFSYVLASLYEQSFIWLILCWLLLLFLLHIQYSNYGIHVSPNYGYCDHFITILITLKLYFTQTVEEIS